ncbi:DUF7144 family membrane protein [Kitasatospora cheerisanensis]|uniref:Integral membrane protein n=1 Tax=Kitasatospora cheerisanensis KCTC 2395 TaxID=1348663 RepID=A0A066Z104_9ACTN|nr:hypothetical protein [Kitasatospora cheerisanensis]KDN87468.1 integral membrane protein [Kitasatospora cheerisanensis KCTC 2395]
MAQGSHERRGPTGDTGGAALPGASMFAGIGLSVSGTLSILLGAAGIAQDSLFSPSGHYAYQFNLTSWGWIHLVIGVWLSVAGIGVLAARSWGRWAGLTGAAISLITQFMFIPYYPLWSITVMTVDLLVLWALARFQVRPA